MEKDRTHPARASRSAGFTLVELVIVLAVLAIMGAIAMPRYSGAMRRYRLDTAAARVTADMELARQQAIAASATRRVTFNTLGYKISDGDTTTSHPAITVSLGDAPYQMTSVAATVAGDNALPLQFDGHGTPNGAGVIVIKVGSDTRTITVTPGSGKAKVN